MKVTIQDILNLELSEKILLAHLFGALNDIARLTDIETAFRFAYKHGGRRIYLPQSPERSVLAEDLSVDVLMALVRQYGHSRKIEISNAIFRPKIYCRLMALKMLAEGASTAQIAHELGVSQASVGDWRRLYLDPVPALSRAA